MGQSLPWLCGQHAGKLLLLTCLLLLASTAAPENNSSDANW